jgi:predicted phage-related endonuclease
MTTDADEFVIVEDPVAELDPKSQHLLAVYEWAKAQMAEAKETMDNAKAELQDYLGEKEIGTVGGKAKVYYSKYETSHFRIKDFRADHPNLAKMYTETKEARRFSLAEDKQEDGD